MRCRGFFLACCVAHPGPIRARDWRRLGLTRCPGSLEPQSPTDQPFPELSSAPSPDPALAAARDELAESQEQLAELEQLIVDLPGIFERKFAQRLQPLLERQRLLSDDNHALRERLQLVLPPAQAGGGGPNQGPDHQVKAEQVSASQSQSQSSGRRRLAWRRRWHQATRRFLRRDL